MLINVVCFLAPLTIAIQIDVGSQLFAAELLLPCVASMIFLKRGGHRFSSHASFLVKLGLAYFAAQVLSDVWNQTTFEQYSRGWARIGLFLINVLSIYVLIDNKRSRLLLFCLGFALGRVWITYTGFDGDAIPWKIGLAKPVALLTIVFCIAMPGLRGVTVYLSAVILLALGIFDIVMDFRSHGAVLIVVAVLLMSSVVLRKQSGRRGTGGLKPLIGLSVAGLIATAVAFQVYVYAAESGWLTENASRKYEAQVQDADAPLLVAGRSEILVYFEAIFDSIIIGHGSWPRDLYYAERLATERYERGISRSAAGVIDDAIPLHSHIFGSWIEAGLVGGVFWLNIIALIIKSSIKSSVGQSHMRPLYLYAAVLLLWDVLFSPFSGFRRLETAFLIVVVLRSMLQRGILAKARVKRRRKRRRRRLRAGGLDSGEAAAHSA